MAEVTARQVALDYLLADADGDLEAAAAALPRARALLIAIGDRDNLMDAALLLAVQDLSEVDGLKDPAGHLHNLALERLSILRAIWPDVAELIEQYPRFRVAVDRGSLKDYNGSTSHI